MPLVLFTPSGQSADVPPGTELLDAARAANVQIEARCGGKGVCGGCLVRVVSGQADCDSPGNLSDAALADGYVLACRTRVLDGPVTIEIPQPAAAEVGKFSDTDETHLIRADLLPRDFEFDPLAVKWLITVPPPHREDGLGDMDRLTRAIQREWGPLDVTFPLSVMRVAAAALRAQGGLVTVTMIRDVYAATAEDRSIAARAAARQVHRLRVIHVEPGDTTTLHFGLAIDVGTTTVAVQLINLSLGRVMATRSDYNGQIPCGLDVLSRINYAQRPGRLAELRSRVLETINTLIGQVASSHRVDPRELSNVVISGNTTMTHLLLGIPPEHIRLDPYTPTVLSLPFLGAGEVGLITNPDAWVYLSPAVGSYVGGDITAGLLCTDLPTATDHVSLFIDIGTNGELVLGNAEFLMTCACSAGPAFEGGGIDCGMRAAVGAIERVDVDPATGCATWETIGRVRPKGICGSGMIDLLAKLLRTGWIDPAGKLDRSRPSPAIHIDGRKAVYEIVPADQSGRPEGEPVAISEIDIENIVRAKAAIYSACALMLHHAGIEFADLANVYIAGGFGRFLDLENAKTIGLLADLPAGRFHYLGNTSLTGSYMIAVSADFRRRQLELARRMTCIDLSTQPGYMEQYTAALFLPHTDRARFASVWEKIDAGRKDDAARARQREGATEKTDLGAPLAVSRTSASPDNATGNRKVDAAPEPTNKQKALLDAIDLAAAKLRAVDLAAQCRWAGLPAPSLDGAVHIQTFGQDLRLTPPDFAATVIATGLPPRLTDRLLALHYLLCDRPIRLAGELIGFRDLPGGAFYLSSFVQRTTDPLVARFGNDLDALRANLARFAWAPKDMGDLGAEIQAIGLIAVTLVYHRGDEEFGPSAEVFFDSALRQVFTTEDATVLASRVCLGLL